MKSMLFGLTATAALVPCAYGADVSAIGINNRSIAYVTSHLHYSVHETEDGKQECPDGINLYGPREVFAMRYPEGGTVADTVLREEAAVHFPRDRVDTAPYTVVKGKIGRGLNLDGEVGPDDLISPDGERGIDNQFYRVVGCTQNFRKDGNAYIFLNQFMQSWDYSRTLIEITNVDDLTNDPDVDIAFYRGLDSLSFDATGERVMPGGSQRIDTRFGKRFERHFKGKIVDGVLTTEPTDMEWPWALVGAQLSRFNYQGVRFKLKLSPGEATGYVGGYADVDDWYKSFMVYPTHSMGFGLQYAQAFYRELRAHADGYPDPETGENTAISFALDIRMAQVFISRPAPRVAQDTRQPPARYARIAEESSEQQ